jgi:hypothetical protein
MVREERSGRGAARDPQLEGLEGERSVKWTPDLQKEVLQEFVDAQRLKGCQQSSRDERPPRVVVEPLPSDEQTSVDAESIGETKEAGTEPQPEDPPSLPRRRVVVEIAPPPRRMLTVSHRRPR